MSALARFRAAQEAKRKVGTPSPTMGPAVPDVAEVRALYQRERARWLERQDAWHAELRAIVVAAQQRMAESETSAAVLKAKAAARGRAHAAHRKRKREAPTHVQTERSRYDRAYYVANREKKIEQAKASFRRNRTRKAS